jgi:hypothetical protein
MKTMETPLQANDSGDAGWMPGEALFVSASWLE